MPTPVSYTDTRTMCVVASQDGWPQWWLTSLHDPPHWPLLMTAVTTNTGSLRIPQTVSYSCLYASPYRVVCVGDSAYPTCCYPWVATHQSCSRLSLRTLVGAFDIRPAFYSKKSLFASKLMVVRCPTWIKVTLPENLCLGLEGVGGFPH